MGPAPAIVSKEKILEHVRGTAELLELFGSRNFGETALRCLDAQPMEEAHHGGGIAAVRGTGAFALGRILPGLGQNGRICTLDDLGA